MAFDLFFVDVGSAEETVLPHRFVAFGATAGKVKQADLATEAILGVSDECGVVVTVATDENRVDFNVLGYAKITYGATIIAGAHLTTDADGKAVTAVATNRVGAMALTAGVAGDIHLVTLIAGSPVL